MASTSKPQRTKAQEKKDKKEKEKEEAHEPVTLNAVLAQVFGSITNILSNATTILNELAEGKEVTNVALSNITSAKKTKKRTRDPSLPGRPKTSYNFFFEEKRLPLKEQGLAFPAISKQLAAEWKTLQPKEKQKYIDRANQDKVRFAEAVKEHEGKIHESEVPPTTPAPIPDDDEDEDGDEEVEGEVDEGDEDEEEEQGHANKKRKIEVSEAEKKKEQKEKERKEKEAREQKEREQKEKEKKKQQKSKEKEPPASSTKKERESNLSQKEKEKNAQRK